MPDETRTVAPYYKPRTVRFDDGTVVSPPLEWDLLPPGDAGLTRRVKAAGPTWTVQQKKGRRMISHGVWAPSDVIDAERARLLAERETPQYQKRLATDAARRERVQDAYADEFHASILAFLNFHDMYADIAERLAEAVTAHAVPVGSGTVARTKRISIEQRAEAAVIAWMRHQTTAYDNMSIARVKGRRREVRGELAKISRQLLNGYRSGATIDATSCPLARAVA